jgi:hypothetical protein
MLKNAIIVVVSIIFLSSAFSLNKAMGQPTATVGVQLAATSGLNQGDTFSTNITVSDVTDLYGWQVSLYYPSSVLNGTRVDEGPFLKAGGASTYFLISNFTDNYNATHGYMLFACTRLGNVVGENGSGTLATVTFKAAGVGPSVLHIDTTGPINTQLANSNGNMISFTTVDGEVTVIPEFPSLAILPLFMIATLVSLVAFRKWKMTGARPKQ